jgi:hypothetical protein
MERLKQLLSALDADSSVDCIKSTFSEIADILLFKSYIKTANKKYRILEIEFYFKNNKHNDNVTIERTEDAGMWWLHDYGVDLSFKSDENKKFYGGILIRSIIPLNDTSNQLNEEKAIYGPRNCCWYLFYSSALEPNIAPLIVMNDRVSRHIGEMDSTTRHLTGKPKKEDGDYRDSFYRFYVKGLNLKIESNYKKASPWK